MAGPLRNADTAVSEILTPPLEAWDLFAALRWLDALGGVPTATGEPTRPRLGTSTSPAQDLVQFCQEPTLGFAPSTLVRLEAGTGTAAGARLYQYALGLLGPDGPMPLHFTEYVCRRKQKGDKAWAHFLDMFHHRYISLFYRAWALGDPATGFDRPGDDFFAACVSSFLGLSMPAFKDRDSVPDTAKLYFAGRFMARSRNAVGLEAALAAYCRVPVGIQPFVLNLLTVPPECRTRLGASVETGQLGATVVVGSQTPSCQHRFRIVMGPMAQADFARFLPGTTGHQAVVDWTCFYVRMDLEFEIQLILRAAEIPRVQMTARRGGLGSDGAGPRLGYNTWLFADQPKDDAADLVLGPYAFDSGGPRSAA